MKHKRLPSEQRPTGDQDVLGSVDSDDAICTTTTAQQALDRFHDEHNPLGRVRRIAWPADEDNHQALTEWDPFS
jgi:hypothetical protein